MSKTADWKELGKDCVAFANASGGHLLLGIEDDQSEPPADQRIPQDLADPTVDWQVRESVRARLRLLVRRTLKKWKYPPKGEDEAVELVLKQAESLSNQWSK